MLTLADVTEALSGQRKQAWSSLQIRDFCVDSRKCTQGALFVALRGEQADGHAYIGDALTHGAHYVLAEARAHEASGSTGATFMTLAEPLPWDWRSISMRPVGPPRLPSM